MPAFSTVGRQAGGLLSGWRGLARFWLALLLLAAIAGGSLQLLGPPAARPIPPSARLASMASPRPAAAGQTVRPGRTEPGNGLIPVAGADPALLEPYAADRKLYLPRIAPDGRAPMSAYAASFDITSKLPRVGMVIAGIGMSGADSLSAIKDLPGGVTLAVSPYAGDIASLLAAARAAGHEYMLSVPMEPQTYPVNDPDDRFALMTFLSPAENLGRLRAILARLTGYVGVTNALGPMRGERFSGMTDQFDPTLREIADRGLLFVDSRPAQRPLPHAWTRSVDRIVDNDPLDAATLDQRLDALTRLALDKGSALGLVSVPRPMTIERVAAWTNTLAAKGVVLAPVSALVAAPAGQENE